MYVDKIKIKNVFFRNSIVTILVKSTINRYTWKKSARLSEMWTDMRNAAATLRISEVRVGLWNAVIVSNIFQIRPKWINKWYECRGALWNNKQKVVFR